MVDTKAKRVIISERRRGEYFKVNFDIEPKDLDEIYEIASEYTRLYKLLMTVLISDDASKTFRESYLKVLKNLTYSRGLDYQVEVEKSKLNSMTSQAIISKFKMVEELESYAKHYNVYESKFEKIKHRVHDENIYYKLGYKYRHYLTHVSIPFAVAIVNFKNKSSKNDGLHYEDKICPKYLLDSYDSWNHAKSVLVDFKRKNQYVSIIKLEAGYEKGCKEIVNSFNVEFLNWKIQQLHSRSIIICKKYKLKNINVEAENIHVNNHNGFFDFDSINKFSKKVLKESLKRID